MKRLLSIDEILEFLTSSGMFDGRGFLYHLNRQAYIHEKLRIHTKEQSEPLKKLSLSLLPPTYAVCQLHPDKHIPYWALLGDFVSLTRTPEELSIVCQQDNVPEDIEAERGWRCVQVQGAFDFSLRVSTPR